MTERVKKRCLRCGHVALVRPRRRHCYQPRFGRGSYACWGQLVTVVREPKTAATKEVETVTDLKRVQDYRAQAATRHEVAAVKVLRISRKIAELSKQLRESQRKERYWAKRAAMSDAELLAERARKQQQATRRQKPRRGIALGGFD